MGEQGTEQRLYGLPFAEQMEFDAAAVYEQVECDRDEEDRTPIVIEEWSVHPAIYHIPSAAVIAERVVELVVDNGELDEYGADQFEAAASAEDVLVAAEALREVLASKVTWRMANKLLRTLTVTFDEAGEPLLDGEPMYVKESG